MASQNNTKDGKNQEMRNRPRLSSAEYECPDADRDGRQYDSINNLNKDFIRGDSRTDEKTIFNQADVTMNEPVYHGSVTNPARATPLSRSTSAMRRSQTTVV